MSDKRDVTDFLPDALAIQHAVLPWYLRHAIPLLGALFVCLLLFFFFMKIDVIVSAPGKLVSDHPTVMLKVGKNSYQGNLRENWRKGAYRSNFGYLRSSIQYF